MAPKRTTGAIKGVKIRPEAFAVLEKLVDTVARHGWAAISRNSTERVTMEAVAAYAIGLLAEKAKKRG